MDGKISEEREYVISSVDSWKEGWIHLERRYSASEMEIAILLWHDHIQYTNED
jgi:hypothetical protein